MKSNNSKKTIYIVTKKYVLLFLLIYISVILFFLEHFTETPISIEDIQTKEIFNAKKSSGGYFAPSFKLRNIKGNYESLESYRGEVVVLNFWATWCEPCRIEMPSFEKLYRRYRSEGVTVLAITLD